MFKLLLIVLLAYLLFRAGRNLLVAAVRDGLVPQEDRREPMEPKAGNPTGRSSVSHADVEDAVWKDLP